MRKLEDIFDIASSDEPSEEIEAKKEVIAKIDSSIDKIDAALPTVCGLDASDSEMDELANLATQSYKDLLDLGMNVEPRFSSEIFAVAGTMLGHAITAKTAKLNKKLKMVDLQLKKAKLDIDPAKDPSTKLPGTGSGVMLSRNELLDHILRGNTQTPDA